MLRVVRLLLLLALATGTTSGKAAEPRDAADTRGPKTRNANRLTYLDENNPWYPHRGFPKLVTPQWVG